MAYGLKIKDTSGNVTTLTPDIGTVIGMGRVTMPSALVDTNKYYTTIALPTTIPVANLTVLATPVKWHTTSISIYPWADNHWFCGAFLDNNQTYYTKNESTGILSSYSAGNRSSGDATTWDNALNAYPLVYWELLGASEVSNIKIFAATCYIHTVPSSSPPPAVTYKESNDFIYSIYTSGVEIIDYIILNKNWNY